MKESTVRPEGPRAASSVQPEASQSHFGGIDHVGVIVADADAAVAYYRDVLRMPVLHDERLDELGARLVYLDMGGAMLQLVEPIGAGRVHDYLELHGEGLHHLCLKVRDIPALLSVLPGETDTEVFQGGRGRRACFLQMEPNHVPIELTEIDPQVLARLRADERTETNGLT